MKKYLAEKVRKIYQEDEDFYTIPYYLKIKNLPKIGDEYIDFENFEWLSITDDEVVVCCGGDWQDPMVLTINLIKNNLVVTSHTNGYKGGLSEDQFNKILFGTTDYDEILK